MNIKDITRIIAGARLVGEHIVRSNGPEIVAKTQRVVHHTQELIASIIQLTRNNADNENTRKSDGQDKGFSGDSAKREEKRPEKKDLFGFTSSGVPQEDKNVYSSLEKNSFKSTIMREKSVPSTQLQRVLGFGSLAASVGMGTAVDRMSNFFTGNTSQEKISQANAERLADALCRLRGAALKLGQMLSLQDSEGMLPPTLAMALERVRQAADFMPEKQLTDQMELQLGNNWKEKFGTFKMSPFAAASIGQVHRAVLIDGSDVVVKVQYPGVAESISSDLNNLKLLVTATNLLPPGLYIDEIIRVARSELTEECNYSMELENQVKFNSYIDKDENLRERVYVPQVYRDMSAPKVLTTEFVHGVPVDKTLALSQQTRNAIARTMLYLTIHELFVFRFMQTDPNFSNFLYDHEKQRVNLIDFGAARHFPKSFVEGYIKLVWAAANKDIDTIASVSKDLGFLTGDETQEMLSAHVNAGLVVGEPFLSNEPFDFAASKLPARLGQYSGTFMKHRLTPPPPEVYSLHRKLAGAFLLCIKLKAVIPCRDILENVFRSFEFSR